LRVCHSAIDARYEGQNFEVQVSLDDTGAGGYAEFARRFAEAHEREYGYTVDDRNVQIINCRMQAVGQVVKAPLAPRHIGGVLEDARLGVRKAYFGAEHGWRETPVYDRDRVPTGARFTGPALLEEMSSTTVVGVGQHVSVDEYGNLIIRLQGGLND
jgi:N-methylhydantoinase A